MPREPFDFFFFGNESERCPIMGEDRGDENICKIFPKCDMRLQTLMCYGAYIFILKVHVHQNACEEHGME